VKDTVDVKRVAPEHVDDRSQVCTAFLGERAIRIFFPWFRFAVLH
jgi:hypothetical protein